MIPECKELITSTFDIVIPTDNRYGSLEDELSEEESEEEITKLSTNEELHIDENNHSKANENKNDSQLIKIVDRESKDLRKQSSEQAINIARLLPEELMIVPIQF